MISAATARLKILDAIYDKIINATENCKLSVIVETVLPEHCKDLEANGYTVELVSHWDKYIISWEE